MFNRFLSLFVSVQVSDAYVNTSSIIVFFSLNTEWVGEKKIHEDGKNETPKNRKDPKRGQDAETILTPNISHWFIVNDSYLV